MVTRRERTKRVEQPNTGSRAVVRRRSEQRGFSAASDDDGGGFRSAIRARASASERSNQTQRAEQSAHYWSKRAEESITSPTCLLLYGGA
jgi:hypothetical protein